MQPPPARPFTLSSSPHRKKREQREPAPTRNSDNPQSISDPRPVSHHPRALRSESQQSPASILHLPASLLSLFLPLPSLDLFCTPYIVQPNPALCLASGSSRRSGRGTATLIPQRRRQTPPAQCRPRLRQESRLKAPLLAPPPPHRRRPRQARLLNPPPSPINRPRQPRASSQANRNRNSRRRPEASSTSTSNDSSKR